MNYLTGALLTATLFTASLVHADLKYIAYNLDSKEANAVTVTDENYDDIFRSDTYRNGTKMLFVQDTTVSTEYYIGVFEVSVTQAKKLGWTNTTGSGVSYAVKGSATYDFESGHLLTNHAALSFPTLKQWQAYADTAVKGRDNIFWNADWPFGLSTWYGYQVKEETPSLSSISIQANGHGVFDIFGNVAEYIPETKQFHGGFASDTCTTVTLDTAHKASEEVFESDAFLGARLIYTPPAYQSFSVTVTLDGETVSTDTYKPGDSVTVTPPTVADGLQLSCTITPSTITGTTFIMPEAHVTFAYSTAKFLRIQVTGGTSDKTEVLKNDTVTLTPTPKSYEVFKNWTLPDGTLSETEELEITFNEALFAAYEPGETLTYTATFDTCPQIIINDGSATHNPETGESLGDGYYTPGTEITLTATAKHGYKCTAWQENEEEATTKNTFVVGDYNTVATFTPVYAPCLYVNVLGGTASLHEVIVGDTLAVSATPSTYQSFREWTLPGGTTSTFTNLSIKIDQTYFDVYNLGDTLTYEAAYNTYPRVLVYGGSVNHNGGSSASLGEGYYKPGTSLGLTANTLDGYTFDTWLKDGETYSGTSYYVDANTYNTTVTFSPVYTISTPEVSGAVTRIGEVQIGETYTSKLELGYVEESPATHEVNSNTFVYYPAALTDKSYLVLDTTKKELVYADSVPGDSKTTAPTLKRIALTGEQPYYVGIYETTIGHVTNMAHAADPNATVDEIAAANAHPQVYNQNTDAFHTQYFANIKEAFGVEISLPTYAQIEGITKAGLGKKETFTGAGFYNSAREYGDPKITSEMIYNGKSGAWYYGEVGTRAPDPYGFYDLWGNVLEMIADGKLRGGHCGSQTALCNLKIDTDSYPSNFPGAFRPAVTVKPQVTVTIASLEGKSFKVFPGQVIHLAEQVAPNARFTGWTATVGETTTEVAKDTTTNLYPYTVTADVTLTPNFKSDIPTITVSYVNCSGPETVLPGSSTQIYATNPGYALKAISLEPANAGTVDVATGTITFASDATGEVTVKATYDTPKVSGYILKLK